MIRTKKIKHLPIKIIDRDRSSRYPKRSEFREKGVLFLNTTNIVQNRLDITEANFVLPEKFDAIKKGRLQWFDIVMYPVISPSEQITQRFSSLVQDVVDKIYNLIFRNRNLRQTRDLLLPKLISGEIDVSELNIDID